MTDFDCDRFARALDEGFDPALRARLEAHAAACPGCADRLAAEDAVLALFATPGAAVPPLSAGWTERVMALVAQAPQVDAVPATAPAAEIVPWWIRAAAHPASVLALLLAGVAVLFTPQLLGASYDAPRWSAGLFALLTPRVDNVTAATYLPLVSLVAAALYLLGAKLARAPFIASVARVRQRGA